MQRRFMSSWVDSCQRRPVAEPVANVAKSRAHGVGVDETIWHTGNHKRVVNEPFVINGTSLNVFLHVTVVSIFGVRRCFKITLGFWLNVDIIIQSGKY